MLISARIRRSALEMVYRATSGHLGGSFSLCELLAVLYFREMHIDPAAPADPDRDRFVLSKGHCTPALYSALAFRGYFPQEELKSFRRLDGHMSGHAEMHHVKGVDMSTGSLGQGISATVGMALAGKLDSKDYRVYAVLGDGEIQEGQVWEAAMAAGNFGLDNLCAIAANKFPGVRAAAVSDAYSARLTRSHNDSNILCLDGRMLGRWQALEIVRVWLDTPYDGGHHQGSLDLLRQMEEAMMNGTVWCPEEVPYPPFTWDPDQPL